MQLEIVPTALPLTALLCITSAVTLADDNSLAASAVAATASEFEIASIVVEQNATDGDTEIVMLAKPDSDKGLVSFTVQSPDGRKLAKTKSPKSTGGLREFAFESPEPPGDAILASYPEGDYLYVGKTADGERFAGTATLSHVLPASTTILFPAQDASVGSDALTIQWSQVPDIAEFRIEIENESADPEQVLTLNVPADVTSFEVPSSLLVPGADYQVGIASVAENGNIVGVEVQFSTAE